MELHELNRMFDQIAPTPEQKQNGLNRLLQTDRKEGQPHEEAEKIDGGVHCRRPDGRYLRRRCSDKYRPENFEVFPHRLRAGAADGPHSGSGGEIPHL